MSLNDFGRLLARGLKGEELVREWLMELGYFVLPTSLINNGGAPAFTGYLKDIISPDVLVAKQGETWWVEVKTYTRDTFNMIHQRWEHGVSQRLFNNYLECERVSGIKGKLAILELKGLMVLVGDFDRIAIGSRSMPPEHSPRGKAMIFFDKRRFDWYRLETLELINKATALDTVPPQTVRPWEDKPSPKERQTPLF